LASSNIHNLTYTLILHPITACLSCLAVLCDLYGAKYDRWGTGPTALSVLAALVAFVSWVLDAVLFKIVKDEFVKSGFGALYGAPMWLPLLTSIILTCAVFYYQPCEKCRGHRCVSNVAH
jgi:hypothetical protein